MKELRDIKLDLLMGNQNPIVNLFNQITSGINIINCNVYNEEGLEFIYYQPSTNEWIFYQDAKNENFWCNFSTYWSLFASKLGLEYQEIQSITKYCFTISQSEYLVVQSTLCIHKVEEALKREVSTPEGKYTFMVIAVEEALKREVNTTTPAIPIEDFKVEEALKREVNTTIRCKTNNCIPVEEVLKRDLGTPEADPVAGFFHVEDALLSAREWLEPLKKELGTPLTTLNNVFALEVEEALKKEIAAPDKMTAMVNGLVERYIKKIKNK